MGGGGGGWLYLTLHHHHQNESCVNKGSGVSHFNVSFVDKGTNPVTINWTLSTTINSQKRINPEQRCEPFQCFIYC